MKYSIILPYYKRAALLRNTLASFRHHYAARNDYEVIIVEDVKNARDAAEHEALGKVIEEYRDIGTAWMIQDKRETMCPGTAYNMGVKASAGEFIVISNPECLHDVDILAGLDAEFEKDPGCYVVCACLGLDETGTRGTWYQHSKSKDHKLNHCTAISRANYERIGGFDEEFANGYARADIDLVWTIMDAGIPIIERDDLLTAHQRHDRDYGISQEELRAKMRWSAEYLKSKWENRTIRNADPAWVKRVQEVCW